MKDRVPLIIKGRLPWGQLPPLPSSESSLIYEAERGWLGEQWYDGPRIVIENGVILQYRLPGSLHPLPLRDLSPSRETCADWIMAHEALAWKKSLAWAFRERLRLDDPVWLLQNIESEASHALVLLGLRIAFPSLHFFAMERPERLAPQWKRFCQNLNLSTWAAPSQLKNLPALEVKTLSKSWPEPAARKFWGEFPVPVLPHKLLQEFSMGGLHP